MSDETWPPELSLDQEKILNLLTGERFYSNPSAALREAVLNTIDAVHRQRKATSDVGPEIRVIFSSDDLTLKVVDNGIGMSQTDVSALFTKIGASAATNEAKKDSVGEFGIGVISYFMAGTAFTLQTYDGTTVPIGLSFDRHILSGGAATEVPPTQQSRGTAITIHIKDRDTFDLLLDNFPHWCRDVEGLSGELLPDRRILMQKGSGPRAPGVGEQCRRRVRRRSGPEGPGRSGIVGGEVAAVADQRGPDRRPGDIGRAPRRVPSRVSRAVLARYPDKLRIHHCRPVALAMLALAAGIYGAARAAGLADLGRPEHR